MKNRFDSVVFFYDQLAEWVFGKEWRHIQEAPADLLATKKDVLIVGGGTGALLEKLPAKQQVTYLDLSAKMLHKAQERRCKATVHFVHQDYLKWTADQKYEAILFPFFLDSLPEDQIREVLSKARTEMIPEGELHVIDFQRGNRLQNFLVWVMYRFFRLATNLESKTLVDIFGALQSAGFKSIHEMTYLERWIAYRVVIIE